MEESDGICNRIPTYRRVLVPTDFSKKGNSAIAFAYGAASRGGEVCLVHVVRPTGGFRPRTEKAHAANAKMKQEIASRLEPLIPDDALSRGIRSKVEIVEHEHPSVAISQAAERCGADLICIGSRGRSGLKKKLLGSVTESLMKRSKCPVLVIRS
jgi:nucleotide-binding universal stress UspA family protein